MGRSNGAAPYPQFTASPSVIHTIDQQCVRSYHLLSFTYEHKEEGQAIWGAGPANPGGCQKGESFDNS